MSQKNTHDNDDDDFSLDLSQSPNDPRARTVAPAEFREPESNRGRVRGFSYDFNFRKLNPERHHTSPATTIPNAFMNAVRNHRRTVRSAPPTFPKQDKHNVGFVVASEEPAEICHDVQLMRGSSTQRGIGRSTISKDQRIVRSASPTFPKPDNYQVDEPENKRRKSMSISPPPRTQSWIETLDPNNVTMRRSGTQFSASTSTESVAPGAAAQCVPAGEIARTSRERTSPYRRPPTITVDTSTTAGVYARQAMGSHPGNQASKYVASQWTDPSPVGSPRATDSRTRA